MPGAPQESLAALFLRFLRFGLLAWGGPVAQISMLRAELVERERWMDPHRFHRTLAVYQALPGPEATELCVHFGMLARGRIGAIVAGFGFLLPGLVLMLLLSWAYVAFGLGAAVAAGLLAGFTPAVAALVARAAARLGRHALHDGPLAAIAGASAASTFLGLPFYVILPVGGAAYLAWRARQRILGAAALVGLVALAAWRAVGVQAAIGQAMTPSGPAGPAPGLLALAWSGLKAGSLTFGGAYTVIPFLQQDAVGPGGWVTMGEFVDGLALSGVLPAPLIIFATFLGFLGGSWAGALVITSAIFAPAFAFTLIGAGLFERLLDNPRLHAFLDGVTAAVIGLIAVTALGLLRLALGPPGQDVLLLAALLVLGLWPSKAAVPVVVLGSGLAGWLLHLGP